MLICLSVRVLYKGHFRRIYCTRQSRTQFLHPSYLRPPMHTRSTSLVIRKQQSISNDNIFPPSSSKHNGPSDIIRHQRLTPTIRIRFFQPSNNAKVPVRSYLRIHSISLGLITIEPHNRELRLNLPGIDANNTDAFGNQLLAQAVRKKPHSSLGRAVDSATDVWLAAGNGSDVDDVAGSVAIVALQHHRQDGLCHVYQA